MATLHIRDLKDSVKSALRVRAAENGRSMEEEARCILEAATKPVQEENLSFWKVIEGLRAKYGTGDFEVPDRHLWAEYHPVDFGE